WFRESARSRSGRSQAAAQATHEFPIPTARSGPSDITAGPDGALWFTEGNGNKIGQITTAGVITEFPIPTANASAGGITAGPDGGLRFTDRSGNTTSHITTTGIM